MADGVIIDPKKFIMKCKWLRSESLAFIYNTTHKAYQWKLFINISTEIYDFHSSKFQQLRATALIGWRSDLMVTPYTSDSFSPWIIEKKLMSMISSYTDYSIALWNGWRSGLNDSWLESITLLYPATARREYNSMPDSGHPRLWSNRTHTQTRSSRAHAPRPNTVNTHTSRDTQTHT